MLRRVLRRSLEKVPAASLFYRNMRDLLDQHQPSLKTPWGFQLAGHNAMATGDFEREETTVVRGLLKDVDILVNVGANIGYYCCHALSMGKEVIAVEPVARNVRYLLRNIQANGWAHRAQVFPVALGLKTDILEMWGGGTGASLVKGWASAPESYKTEVPVLTLDRVLGDSLAGRRALILVDIEGAEHMMLEGAKATLRQDPKPTWIVEISSSQHQPVGTAVNPHFQKTFDIFFQHGYEARTADATASEVTREIVAAVAGRECTIANQNFVFRAIGRE